MDEKVVEVKEEVKVKRGRGRPSGSKNKKGTKANPIVA